jgi:hypothetical protein
MIHEVSMQQGSGVCCTYRAVLLSHHRCTKQLQGQQNLHSKIHNVAANRTCRTAHTKHITTIDTMFEPHAYTERTDQTPATVHYSQRPVHAQSMSDDTTKPQKPCQVMNTRIRAMVGTGPALSYRTPAAATPCRCLRTPWVPDHAALCRVKSAALASSAQQHRSTG